MQYTKLKAVQKEENENRYTIVATTDDIDRDGDVVVPSGATNMQKYLSENPVILFGHDHRNPPIGKATDARITEHSMELDIEFAGTEFGKEIKYLYDNGFMNSFSIGFIPTNHKVVDDQWYWTEWELLEVSAVPVPANSAANMLRTVKSYGVKLPEVEDLYWKSTGGAKSEKPVTESTKKGGGYWHEYIQRTRSRKNG